MPLAMLVRDRSDRSSEPRKLIHAEAHPCEWVALERVESRRDKNQLWTKLPQDGERHRVVRELVIGVGSSGIHRQVHREAEPLASSNVRCRAGSRIVRILMRGDEQDRGVFIETPL